MAESIFDEISEQAEILTYEDLDNWVVPSVMTVYDRKLRYLAFKAYGYHNEVPELAVAAFKESAKEELRTALSTFLFKKEHWRNGRDLDPYLRLCLNRLAQRRSLDAESAKIKNSPVCPLCREDGCKQILIPYNGMFRCNNCIEISNRIKEEIKAGKADAYLQCKYNAHAKFAMHSKKGYRCPECSKFIPESLVIDEKITCPYYECLFSGNEMDVEPCTHPTVSIRDKRTQSLGSTPTSASRNDTTGKYVSAFTDASVPADAYYDLRDQFEHELNVLTTVILEQLERVKRTNSKSTGTQKLLMYKAFQKMLEKYPIEMVSYLVHREQSSDFPIQARIFQTYTELVENHMPFTIIKRGEEIDIVDLTSPDLALFNGISEFEAEVRSNGTIPNRTKEEYIGGRNYKNYGPCFLGKIIDIIDMNTGESIKSKMLEFSFSQIKMDSVEPGTPVKVTHFRILSHYEMDSLVFLQRTRRDIVDSVHFRMNNEKRKVGNK